MSETLIVDYNSFISKEQLKKMVKQGVKTIVHNSTGHDNVKAKHCKELGLEQKWLPDYSSDSVADLSLLFALSIARQIQLPTKNKFKKNYVFSEHGSEFYGKNCLVIGSEGSIGKKVCRRFSGLGMNIKRFDKKFKYHREQLLEGFLTIANVIVICINGEGNKDWFNWSHFKKMSRKPILINVVRKEVVREINVKKALERRLISGYAVDDVIFNPYLKEHSCVIYTNHVGSKTIEAQKRKETELKKIVKN